MENIKTKHILVGLFIISMVIIWIWYTRDKHRSTNQLLLSLDHLIPLYLPIIYHATSVKSIYTPQRIKTPIYFINIDKHKDRRVFTENQLMVLSNRYVRIKGIDVMNTSIKYNNSYTLSPSELGCTLSHIDAIQTAYNNKEKVVFKNVKIRGKTFVQVRDKKSGRFIATNKKKYSGDYE